MIRTVIVEDEPPGRDLLRSYISDHADRDLVGEAINGHDGMPLNEELRPDLMLLDTFDRDAAASAL